MILTDKLQLRGFTVIEMAVVIGVITILAAAITPTLSRYLPGIQLNGAARTLSSNLREAQEKAVTEQKQYTIQFTVSGSPPYYQMISQSVVIKTVNLSNDESISLDPTITGNQITFSPDGGPSSSGNITLSNGSASKVINVSPAGFIKNQ